jgi:histidinol dehydrogenase
MRVDRIRWDGNGAEALAGDLRRAAEPPADLSRRVAEIIGRVRREGDAALLEMSVELDGAEQRPKSLKVPREEVEAAYEALDPDLVRALRLAETNIRGVAEAELRAPVSVDQPQGHSVSIVERPVRAAGVYAPGGRAAYPSSVLMGLVPARVAGVPRIVLASPPGPDGKPPAAVLAAARVGEADEVYAIGGAQAVAALAMGTGEVQRVDVIAGPGNAWVTEAKRQLYGTVGIDGLAGPSELVVVADAGVDARGVALDALAQAEHGADSPIVVVSPSQGALDRVAAELAALDADRPSVADAPITLVESPSLDFALELSDAFAPEHLELRFAGAEDQANARVAGCVFVGEAGVTAFGDYTAGSNHVLPTAGAARYSGPLGTGAFMRRMSVVNVPRAAAAKLIEATDTIARSEGLPVHGESAIAQLQRANQETR